MAGVHLQAGSVEALSDSAGFFQLRLPAKAEVLRARYLGYRPLVVALEADKNDYHLQMVSDPLGLAEVVVSATRQEVEQYRAPVVVHKISRQSLENVQAYSLAEGLSFSPGLRVENNCQNCGFTQLRINGLDGAYSQILINSRPIFSALMGVYGLELFPPEMVDRIEVVKGGGSALYGSNAIGGTVNIITQEPLANGFGLGADMLSLRGEAWQRSTSFHGSFVNNDRNAGLRVFAFERNREQWDANSDGFSELTALENLTLGLDAYWKPSARQKVKLNLFRVDEFRRGGSNFDRKPHESEIAEQLEHEIWGGGLSYELLSHDLRHQISFYTSAQQTQRASYYGGGGRPLAPGDSLRESDLLALNAYGDSDDHSLLGGMQYTFLPNEALSLTLGSELQSNRTLDEMPGYDRAIEQQVSNWGSYLQLQWNAFRRLELLAGLRLENVQVNGDYRLNDEEFINQSRFAIPAPRLNLKYRLGANLNVRASYARGFRVPQAFDEDLHIETVGGSALFIRLDPNLQTEYSNSYLLSLNYNWQDRDRQQTALLEFFRTDLQNPFVLSGQRELPNGTAVITKRNGAGAWTQGLNVEYNLAWGNKWLLQSGFTWQEARYRKEEVLWAPDAEGESPVDSVISTRKLLRTPLLYGYLNATYQPLTWLKANVSANYTGPMPLPHVIEPESEFTVIRESPDFLEVNLKLSFTLPAGKRGAWELYCGLRNLFDAYQSDFDRGAERDAGYVYGPLLPRSYFGGLRFTF